MSYHMEQLIEDVIYSLLAYGNAYIFITPNYLPNLSHKEGTNTCTNELFSIQIDEIEGFIKKRSHDFFLFCRRVYNGTTSDVEIAKNQLIIFDIRDLGYSRRYFEKTLKKISKYDVTSAAIFMADNNIDVYDYTVHSKKYRIMQMKASRKTGWTLGVDGLSECQCQISRSCQAGWYQWPCHHHLCGG